MDNQSPSLISPEDRAERRARRQNIRKQKMRVRRRQRLKRLLPSALMILTVILVAASVKIARGNAAWDSGTAAAARAGSSAEPAEPEAEASPAYCAVKTDDTVPLGEDFSSGYAVLIDLSTNRILAEKEAETVISPASMTKILTVLVAAEHVTDLNDAFTVPIGITDYCYENDCSTAGFCVGETVTVRDLFYGTVLPSGADAALGLATYVAGSQDAFVKLMNAKLAELGLSETAHFTNCVGLYDADHYCTVYDMAMILHAAVQNDLCREVLSAHTYTTAATNAHPEGILLSNWFLRRIEDKDTGDLSVVCAKTGYVTQSGSCAASYAVGGDGTGYLCVTADTYSSWRCIYDHAELYRRFSKS